jgi:hypothetical protein
MFQDGNNTGVEVPADVIEEIGAGKRPPVVVDVRATGAGYTYRSTIAPMGGKYLIPFSAQRRAESGIGGGDAVEVTLTLDTAPRTVEVPGDLAAAIAESNLTEAWEKLSPSRRKAHVTSVEGAKAAETRARRIAAVVTALAG